MEVECADGVTRPADDCRLCADGCYYPADECVQTYDEEWHHEDDVVRLVDGTVAHPDDDCIVCRADGEYDWLNDCTEIDGEWYPDDQVDSCSQCRDHFLLDRMYIDPNGDRICRGCYDEEVRCCDECSEEIWDGDSHWDEDSERTLCESCYDDRPQSLIRCYSDKSANNLRPESRDKLLFGIELEVESKSDAETGAEWVRQHLPDSYCVFKHDGSLGDSGFEIVTRPDSMAVHKRLFAPMLDANPGRKLRSWMGGRCGMHVHVTKSALSELQLGKMLCFLNDADNAAFVSTVAGRLPCTWCKVSPKKPADVRHNADRYVALNITRRTAEFRIFRGTLLASSFYKNLELVQALVAFCAPAQRSIADAVSHRKFCEWLDKKDYPHLWQYLSSKGYRMTKRRAG